MSRQLQEYAFNKSQYERPTLNWVCGWASEGKACHFGPDEKGRCFATFECTPIRKGDRWFCTRPEGFGGICSEDPLPDGYARASRGPRPGRPRQPPPWLPEDA